MTLELVYRCHLWPFVPVMIDKVFYCSETSCNETVVSVSVCSMFALLGTLSKMNTFSSFFVQSLQGYSLCYFLYKFFL